LFSEGQGIVKESDATGRRGAAVPVPQSTQSDVLCGDGDEDLLDFYSDSGKVAAESVGRIDQISIVGKKVEIPKLSNSLTIKIPRAALHSKTAPPELPSSIKTVTNGPSADLSVFDDVFCSLFASDKDSASALNAFNEYNDTAGEVYCMDRVYHETFATEVNSNNKRGRGRESYSSASSSSSKKRKGSYSDSLFPPDLMSPNPYSTIDDEFDESSLIIVGTALKLEKLDTKAMPSSLNRKYSSSAPTSLFPKSSLGPTSFRSSASDSGMDTIDSSLDVRSLRNRKITKSWEMTKSLSL